MFQVQKISSTIYPDESRRPFWLHNFMSHESPYNGLLLYHGLGSGREEIVRMVTQEYQDYMRQTNRVKPIYRVNSAFPKLEAGALVVLDDVHKTDYSSLLPLLENVTVKLLLLSPTPMFSSPSDLVDVLNLLRVNDKRRRIDVLNPDNTLRDPETLANSVHGYVAFVEGDPTSFRIYPSMFHPKPWKYPRNKREGALVPRVDRVDVYTVTPQKPQLDAYHRAKTDEAKLMALTMSYPEGSANVFDPDILPLYSAKIAALCRSVQNPGICLVYTRFYEGGALPVAHALESMGFSRHTGASLSGKPKTPLKYALWHGAPVAAEWAAAVHPDTGLKVVVVTDVDGVDLVNVRQIHVLDPLPHMDRLERLLSRGVRDGSHATLPLEERNCQIYLYASLMDEEAVDMFVYRQAETNALKVGQVTRLLRMNAMNCGVQARPLKTVRQRLADGQTIHFPLGDKDGSAACDYLTCLSNVPARSTDVATEIARAFKRHYVLSSRELVREVRLLNPEYTRAFIVAVAREMVKRGHPLVDRVGTTGRLAYAYDTFLFQPLEGAVAQLEADLKRDPWCAVAAESPIQSPEALVAHLIESMPDPSALLVEVLRRHSVFGKLVFDYFQKNKYGDAYVLLTPTGIQCFAENGDAVERELPEIRLKPAKFVGVVDGQFKVREGRRGRDCGRVLKELTKTRPRNRIEACVELELLLRMTNTPSNRSFLTPLENYLGQ